MTTQSIALNGCWTSFEGPNADDPAANTAATDLINIVDAIDVPIVVARRDLTIACFNKVAADVLGLLSTDVGRAARDVPVLAGISRLERQYIQVITEGVEARADLCDGNRWFVVRMSSWTTGARRVGGVVLTFTNVTAFRASIDQAIYERECTKAILNTVADPLVILSADQRIESGNRAFYTMFQVSRDETQGVPLCELGNGAFALAPLRTQLELLLAGSKVFEPVEVGHVITQKGRRTLLLSAHPLSLPGHRERRVLVTFQDITVRKLAEAAKDLRSEEELRHSEALLAEGQRLSSTGTFSWKVASDEITWSEQLYRIYEFEIGVPVTLELMRTRVHPDDLTLSEKMIEEARRGGEDVEWQYRLVMPDHSIKYLHAVARATQDRDGQLEYIAAIQDVTERQLADQALRESERSLRSAIDGIPGLVGILAPNGDVETVNRQILEYCGQSLEELRDWRTNGTVHQEDLPHVAEVFTRSIASGIPYQLEQRLRRFDGHYRWFDNRGVPIRDDSGHIVRWYVLLTDIEDRTQALARLQQMQSDFAHMNRVSVMGELAASLSHEITQPIASARNNARAAQNFLKMQPPDLGEVREALACVVGDADRVGDIIDRIREQMKKAPPRKERFDLNAAIIEVIVLGQSVTLRNGVSVQTRLAGGLLLVLGDRVQLQQVLLNLILNAAEAMSSVEEGARELLISTKEDQTGVVVAVRDSGPGIDPEHLDRVFEAFYTTKSSGTGMGLSICWSIIHAHGGKLWAEANEPRGAVFQFTLPAAERELTNPLPARERI